MFRSKELAHEEAEKITKSLPKKRFGRPEIPKKKSRKTGLRHAACQVYKEILKDHSVNFKTLRNKFNIDQRRIREVLCVLETLGLYIKTDIKTVHRKTNADIGGLSRLTKDIHNAVILFGPITIQELSNKLQISKRPIRNVVLVLEGIGMYKSNKEMYRALSINHDFEDVPKSNPYDTFVHLNKFDYDQSFDISTGLDDYIFVV